MNSIDHFVSCLRVSDADVDPSRLKPAENVHVYGSPG